MGNAASDKHIMEELLKTGYPLEIKVSEELERNWNWIVFNNEPYFDEDASKTREIDVSAIHVREPKQLVLRSKKSPFFLEFRLALECKKSDTHAWIFFTRPEIVTIGIGDGQTDDFLNIFSKGKKSFLNELQIPTLHYSRFKRAARTYCEVKYQGQSSGKSEIFEASNQLAKFLSFDMERERKTIAETTSSRDVMFYFAAVIFEGKLYEAIVKKGKLQLTRKDHVLLKTGIRSKVRERYFDIVIDVVTTDGISRYLKCLEEDTKILFSCFMSNRKKLESKADDLMEFFE
jgi:hypothetical protein